MKQIFDVENNNLFIGLLPAAVQNQIRKDLELHFKQIGEELLIDPETGDYLAMANRFWCIEDIYREEE